MRKVFPIIFLSLLFFSFIPSLIFADCTTKSGEFCPSCVEPGGLVPCGRNCDDPTTSKCECEPCQLCDFFVMLDKWIDRLLFMVVPPLAVLMIAIGGGMYIIGQGKPEMLSKAKSLFTSVVIGLVIIYGAWLIVNLFLTAIGTTVWQGPGQGWWIIPCD